MFLGKFISAVQFSKYEEAEALDVLYKNVGGVGVRKCKNPFL